MGGDSGTQCLHAAFRNGALERLKLRQILLDECMRSGNCSSAYEGVQELAANDLGTPNEQRLQRKQSQLRSQPASKCRQNSQKGSASRADPKCRQSQQSYDTYNENEKLPEMDQSITLKYYNQSRRADRLSGASKPDNDESIKSDDLWDSSSHSDHGHGRRRRRSQKISSSDDSHTDDIRASNEDDRQRPRSESKGSKVKDDDHGGTNKRRASTTSSSQKNSKQSALGNSNDSNSNSNSNKSYHRCSTTKEHLYRRTPMTKKACMSPLESSSRNDESQNGTENIKEEYTALKMTLADLQSQLINTQSQVHKYTTMMHQAQEKMTQLKDRNGDLERRNEELEEENTRFRELLAELERRGQLEGMEAADEKDGDEEERLKNEDKEEGGSDFVEDKEGGSDFVEDTRHNASNFLWDWEEQKQPERKPRAEPSKYTANNAGSEVSEDNVSISWSVSRSDENDVAILVQDFPSSDINESGGIGTPPRHPTNGSSSGKAFFGGGKSTSEPTATGRVSRVTQRELNDDSRRCADAKRDKNLSSALADTIRNNIPRRRATWAVPQGPQPQRPLPTEEQEIPRFVQFWEDDAAASEDEVSSHGMGSPQSSFRGRGRVNLERQTSTLRMLLKPWQKKI